MADTKISSLSAITSLLSTDELVVARAGTTKKIAATNLGVWTPYTPVLTASSSNPTLGSGSVAAGKYVQIGKLVVVNAGIQFGSTGLSVGSGTYRVSLPVNAAFAGNWVGTAFVYDSSAASGRIAIIEMADATYVQFWVDSATARMTHASPWTWASNDQIQLSFSYESV